METFLKPLQEPACRRPEPRKTIPAQDLFQHIKVKGRKASGGSYEFLKTSDQRRSVKSLDQCSLWTGHLQQHSLALDPARSELFSGAGLHGKGRIQEANGKPIQKKGTAAPGNIKSALVPHRISRPKKLQGAVMGEYAIRMHRHRHEERIRTEIFNRNRRRDDSVYLPGHAF